ncbi:MAG: PHP domain-containing protein [Spirochaetaceae bacterium]
METISLDNLKEKMAENGPVVKNIEVNNHVHTTYSFSPYSPTSAAFYAWKAGLNAVGIMDHDSISGANELLEACKVLGIASTAGFEVRVNMNGTTVQGKKLNNPDSKNIAYMAVHGIPASKFSEVEKFIAPLNIERNRRNREEVKKLNELILPFSLDPIDFEKDIVSISNTKINGSITERHILYALAKKIAKKYPVRLRALYFIENVMRLDIPLKVKEFLLDEENPHYLYDLLGILKSNYLPSFFIQPTEDECIGVQTVVDFANLIGALPTYAYLGDVGNSSTGDKKAEKFEDDFLDELLEELKRIGFKAITYMPPRNSKKQLNRVKNICKKLGFMEISGVDINSSRQSFNCPEVLDPDFSHLIGSTWALIAHEKLTNIDSSYSIFSKNNKLASLSLEKRISCYEKIGRLLDPSNPVLTDEIQKIINEEKMI